MFTGCEATEDNCVLFVRTTFNNKLMRDIYPWKFIFLHLVQQVQKISLTLYRSIICEAVYSLDWFKGLNLISEGALAVKVNGPETVSKSWVPIATNALFLERKKAK